MKLHKIAFILLVIGGLNWGLAAFGWDLASWGLNATLLMVIYILVGLSAVYELFGHGKRCKECGM